ncbi:MAG: response regulator transcription factor [Bryobacteraceae bacterium]|jgi:DNA-binding NarL/FixJ family response regulator
MERIRLYTDREMMALGLAQALVHHYDLEILGLDRLADSVAMASPIPAEVLILDAPPEALRLLARLRTQDPDVPIVVWQRGTASEPALNALGAGAHAVLLDSSSGAEIYACLEAVLHGGIWVPPSVAQAVVASRRCNLTRREGQLLNLVSQGLSNKELAYALGITVGTVKVYLSRLFDKLEVSDRYELALLGLRQGGSVNAGPIHGGSHRPVALEADTPGIKSVFVPRIHEKWQHGESWQNSARVALSPV